ncbi:MAG: retron St85 family RNA-directed DNA polymerase [Clostridia bacterium]|jgi:RNA-directed DNA polymerase|nr:retron St85 family RNA-directed DNA polymerase [Clostridia bacterium]
MDIKEIEKVMISQGYENEYIELCTSYASNLNENGFPVIFDSIHLAMLIGIDVKELYSYYILAENLYKEVNIPKRTGGNRKISMPCENLKYIQKWILDNVLYKEKCSESSTGFMPHKSIVDNAKLHVNKECIINLDIKDFFPNIKYMQIYNLFCEFGYSRHLSMVFSGLCTYKSVLPQGAPTSPYLSNLICKRLDAKLLDLANFIEASYTRYADDITFSGEKKIAKHIKLIRKIIINENFIINEKKVRVQFKHHKQVVTGLVVNTKLSVPRKTKKYLRQQIYYAKKYGVKDSLERQNITKSNYRGHLFGYAYFIRMVEEHIGDKFIEQLCSIDWES